jgi:integrase
VPGADKGWAERLRALRHDVRHWERREAAGVTRAEVKALIADVAARTPDTAGQVLRELRTAYAHALDRERIPDSADPTAHVKPPKESRYITRDRAFTAEEWRGWLQWLPASGISQDVADALQLIALTRCRPGEATGAKWADVDLKGATWTIRERKRDGEHLIFSVAASGEATESAPQRLGLCVPVTVPPRSANPPTRPRVGYRQRAEILPACALDSARHPTELGHVAAVPGRRG